MLVDARTDFILGHLVKDSGAAVEPDAAPTFRVFNDAGVAIGGGTASLMSSGAITAATNASPIVVTSNGHGLVAGMRILISGVNGNAAANNYWTVTAPVAANTFALLGSSGSGAYTSGGTWRVVGLYKLTFSGSLLAAIQAGKTYTVVVYYAISGAARADQITFTAV